MLNPLVAAQQKIYTIQQNINNALDETYHRRSVELTSTEFNKYVGFKTVRSGDFEQDVSLLSSRSSLSNKKTYAEQQTSMSTWTDSWLQGKSSLDKLNNTPNADAQMNWFESGRLYAESQVTGLQKNLQADTAGASTILIALARTNDTSMPGVDKESIKDVQYQLLNDLSGYMSFTARYEGDAISVSLPSGEPLVQGSFSAVVASSGDDITLSFQGATFNTASNRIGGSIGAVADSIDTWRSLSDKISGERNKLAVNMNGWNNSFGSSPIYTLDMGNVVPSVYNNGSIDFAAGMRAEVNSSNGSNVVDANGSWIASNTDINSVNAFKVVYQNGIYNIYSQSTTSNEWTLDSSDASLANAVTAFNNKNNSVFIASSTINTAPLSGDTWEWHASGSSVSKTGVPATGFNVGASRTDSLNTTSELTFIETVPGYSSSAGLTLTINGAGQLTGFPNGSTVKVLKPDGSIQSVNITPATAPTWSENDIYEYNGSRWRMSGESTAGASWVIKPSVVSTHDNNKNIDFIESDTLKEYQSLMGLNTRNANNAFKVQEKYLAASELEWQSKNGVNLDEEALELTKAKQWYESLAKVQAIETGLWNTFLDSI